MKYDLEETTRRFHNIYEQVAKEYGYKTREDTKELDFNSPNGMTMLKTVEMITTPYLEEIERLENIIKEVREYIEKEYAFTVDISGKKTTVVGYTKGINKMLEILNKVGDNNENI